MTGRLQVWAPDGCGEVAPGADLAALFLATVAEDPDCPSPEDGDVVLVTSKVVSKAERRARPGAREEHLAGETARVVARRGPTTIVRTRHGLTLAAAGVDASNVAAGQVLLLPEDPDGSAAAIRDGLLRATGRRLAVVVTDTVGRPWREGQTDLAVGASGLRVQQSWAGEHDPAGHELAVTAPAVADELAAAAELGQGKLARRPFALVRGRADLVVARDEPGEPASALVRPVGADMFGLGTREAVLAALRGAEEDAALFGSPAAADEVAAVLTELAGTSPGHEGAALSVPAPDAGTRARIGAAAFALGWTAEEPAAAPRPHTVLVRPRHP